MPPTGKGDGAPAPAPRAPGPLARLPGRGKGKGGGHGKGKGKGAASADAAGTVIDHAGHGMVAVKPEKISIAQFNRVETWVRSERYPSLW